MKINGVTSSPEVQIYEQIVGALLTQLSAINAIIADKLSQEPPPPVDAEMEMLEQVSKELAKAQQNLNRAQGKAPTAPKEIDKTNETNDNKSSVNKEKATNTITDSELVRFDIR